MEMDEFNSNKFTVISTQPLYGVSKNISNIQDLGLVWYLLVGGKQFHAIGS